MIIHQVQYPEKFPINDQIRENKQNMSQSNYKTYIKNYLPVLNNVQNPISKRTMIYELQDITLQAHLDWGDFSRNRSMELKRLEKTVIFNQLVKNNFIHAWKQIYQDVNEYCTEYGILNDYRIKLFIKELEYLSLCVHDILPINNQEQGIHPNDPSILMYSTCFSKNDQISTARKKWHDFIHKDYEFFWDVLSNHIDYRTLTDQETVNLQDIYEIIYFINPDGINMASTNPYYVIPKKTKNDTNPPSYSLQHLLSTKDKITMAPQKHFEYIFHYYDAVRDCNPLTKNHEMFYYNKEKGIKREIMLSTLALNHRHLIQIRLNGRTINTNM